MREEAVRDCNQLMYEAEERGKKIGEYEKVISIGKNMVALGLSPDIIAKVTNLSEADWYKSN